MRSANQPAAMTSPVDELRRPAVRRTPDTPTPGESLRHASDRLAAADMHEIRPQEGLCILDHEWRIVHLNAAAATCLLGRTLAPTGQSLWAAMPEILGSALDDTLRTVAGNDSPVRLEHFHAGRQRWLEIVATPLSTGLLLTIRDLSAQRPALRARDRRQQARRLLNSGNRTIIHSVHEERLLEEICQLAITEGGFQAAFVALASDAGSHPWQLVAQACTTSSAGVFATQQLLAAPGCPLERVAHSAEPLIVDTLAVPKSPWANQASRCGLRDAVCLPLHEHTQCAGVLVLLRTEAATPAPADLQLLAELAANLACGIRRLRAAKRKHQELNAIFKLAASTSTSSGPAFFEQLVRNMGEALDADCSFIARLLPDTPMKARTLAAVLGGQRIDNFDYPLQGTPCEQLLDQLQWITSNEANHPFCIPQTLTALSAQAYVGHRLENAAGEPVGFLFVLYRTPLPRTDFITSTMKIFADRAAAELEREKILANLLYQARHDTLTGLPNRTYFYEQLDQAMKRSRRQNSCLGLLYFDIDRFKPINDTLGHDIGDAVIRTFAVRIRNALREVDFMSRLGGDEFVLLLEDLPGAASIEVVAAKLLCAMQEDFLIKGMHLQVSTSIGIALYHPGMSADELLRRADQAMYRAKQAGRNRFSH